MARRRRGGGTRRTTARPRPANAWAASASPYGGEQRYTPSRSKELAPVDCQWAPVPSYSARIGPTLRSCLTHPRKSLMPYVRGHYRRDGTYVRPHHRRSRRSTRTSSSTRPGTYSRVGTTVPTRPAPASATTRVRGHYRNGSYVRPHYRRISTPAAVAAAVRGGGLLILLVVLALLSGSGTGSQDGSAKQPTTSVSSPAGTSSR